LFLSIPDRACSFLSPATVLCPCLLELAYCIVGPSVIACCTVVGPATAARFHSCRVSIDLCRSLFLHHPVRGRCRSLNLSMVSAKVLAHTASRVDLGLALGPNPAWYRAFIFFIIYQVISLSCSSASCSRTFPAPELVCETTSDLDRGTLSSTSSIRQHICKDRCEGSIAWTMGH
jgi:hypothetical protein